MPCLKGKQFLLFGRKCDESKEEMKAWKRLTIDKKTWIRLFMNQIWEFSDIKRKIDFKPALNILELRKYKNDSIQSKIIPTLKLPLFFTT